MGHEFGEPEVLWRDSQHQFIWLGSGDPAQEDGIPSNQYMIVDGDEAYILDPGGYHIFDRVVKNVDRYVKPEQVKGLFLSHQDPDISAGIAGWLQHMPNAQVIVSGLWLRFLLHMPFGKRMPDVHMLRDNGDEIRLQSGSLLKFIPAHFLHSPANFHVYDCRSKILFSGDLGAGIVRVGKHAPVVENFEEHAVFMEGFHRRYMASNQAVKQYLDRISELDIELICPQHGAIFKQDTVPRFIDWLSRIDVGVDARTW